MSLTINEIKKHLPGFPAELPEVIAEHTMIKEVPEGVEILKEGQYVKMIPIVLEGLVKVFTRAKEKELFLYYIGPAREVITRAMRRLEQEGKVRQLPEGIQII